MTRPRPGTGQAIESEGARFGELRPSGQQFPQDKIYHILSTATGTAKSFDLGRTAGTAYDGPSLRVQVRSYDLAVPVAVESIW